MNPVFLCPLLLVEVITISNLGLDLVYSTEASGDAETLLKEPPSEDIRGIGCREREQVGGGFLHEVGQVTPCSPREEERELRSALEGSKQLNHMRPSRNLSYGIELPFEILRVSRVKNLESKCAISALELALDYPCLPWAKAEPRGTHKGMVGRVNLDHGYVRVSALLPDPFDERPRHYGVVMKLILDHLVVLGPGDKGDVDLPLFTIKVIHESVLALLEASFVFNVLGSGKRLVPGTEYPPVRTPSVPGEREVVVAVAMIDEALQFFEFVDQEEYYKYLDSWTLRLGIIKRMPAYIVKEPHRFLVVKGCRQLTQDVIGLAESQKLALR